MIEHCNQIQPSSAPGRVWPMPLPYPEVQKSKMDRHRKASNIKLGVNYWCFVSIFCRARAVLEEAAG